MTEQTLSEAALFEEFRNSQITIHNSNGKVIDHLDVKLFLDIDQGNSTIIRMNMDDYGDDPSCALDCAIDDLRVALDNAELVRTAWDDLKARRAVFSEGDESEEPYEDRYSASDKAER